MHNSSVLYILRTFSAEEIKLFEDFVSSPYFNKKTAVSKLYKHIKKYAPDFESPRLKKEKVWEALYKGKQYNYGLFKNHIYELTKLAERFILQEKISNDKLKMQHSFLESVFDRQLEELFISKFNSLKNNISHLQKNKNVEAKDKFQFMSDIYLLKSNYSDFYKKHPSIGGDFASHSAYRSALLLYSMLETSINAINMSLKNYYSADKDPVLKFLKNTDSADFISDLLESLKDNTTGTYEILSVYYKYFCSLSNNKSLEKYFDFKDSLLKYDRDFSDPDLNNLYSGLRNAIINLDSAEINRGKEFLDITKHMMRSGILVQPYGLINEITFVSDIQTACSLADHEFIEEFSSKYLKFLPRPSRENMKKFSLAHLYFARNEFERSLEQTMTIKYDLFGVKFYLKNLQMMIFYELDDYNSFLLLLDSYKHFLSKNRSVTESWRKTQTLLIKFLSRLFQLKINSDDFEIQTLKKEITASMVLKKQWMLRKIDELEKKNKQK